MADLPAFFSRPLQITLRTARSRSNEAAVFGLLRPSNLEKLANFAKERLSMLASKYSSAPSHTPQNNFETARTPERILSFVGLHLKDVPAYAYIMLLILTSAVIILWLAVNAEDERIKLMFENRLPEPPDMPPDPTPPPAEESHRLALHVPQDKENPTCKTFNVREAAQRLERVRSWCFGCGVPKNSREDLADFHRREREEDLKLKKAFRKFFFPTKVKQAFITNWIGVYKENETVATKLELAVPTIGNLSFNRNRATQQRGSM